MTATTAALGDQVRRSLGWSAVNNILSRSGTLVTGIVLARLLVPADYGVFAVALVALQLLMSLNDIGLSAAVIRWPGDIERLVGTAWVLVVASSALLFALAWFAAPAFAAALGVPAAVGVLRAMSLALLVDGAVGVQAALLTRAFEQGRRTLADTVNLVVYATVAIVLAKGGLGVWSMVWGRLAGNSVSAAIIWACAPRVRPGWDSAQARGLLRFGLPLAGSSILVVVVANADYVVTGRLLGPVQLGLYLMAFNLSSWPVNMFSFAVRRVSLAAFAQLMDDRARAARAFSRALGLLLAVSVPVCALLSALARPLVHVVYGATWAGAVPALQLLALLGVLRIAVELAYDLLVAAGRSRAVLWLQVLWLAALVPALVLGARWDGIRGVGVAQLLAAVLVVLPAFLVALGREGIGSRGLLRSVARPAVGGLLAFGLGLLAVAVVDGPLLQLAVGGTLGLVAHALAVRPMRAGLRAALSPSRPAASPAALSTSA